jgi:hypothetical protein
MQPLGKRRGCLLGALQIGRVDLLDMSVGERFREAFRAPVSRFAEQGIGFVGQFVRMAHQKNGAQVLSMRTRNERQCYKETDSRNSCDCSHEESASQIPIPRPTTSAFQK